MKTINQYYFVGIIFLSFIGAIDATRLPENFYAIRSGKALSTIAIKQDAPIFYVVVPEYSVRPTKNPEKITELESFMINVEVPANFFAMKSPRAATKPVTLFFNWEEQENHQTRKRAALELAKGIDMLRYRFKKSKVVLVGQGQGGNIINGATHSVRLPLETVIQLSTPIFPSTKQKKKTQYADYVPYKKKIKRMYSFYTEQDFSLLHPTLHPHYERIYIDTSHSQLANVLLLINNKHPLPVETMRPLIGKKLLALCKKIKDSYLMHNHFVAHLSTIKPTTDMVVVLRNNDVLNKRKRSTERIIQERLLSEIRMKKFEKEWGRPMALALNKGEKSRKKYESIKKQTAQQKRV